MVHQYKLRLYRHMSAGSQIRDCDLKVKSLTESCNSRNAAGCISISRSIIPLSIEYHRLKQFGIDKYSPAKTLSAKSLHSERSAVWKVCNAGYQQCKKSAVLTIASFKKFPEKNRKVVQMYNFPDFRL